LPCRSRQSLGRSLSFDVGPTAVVVGECIFRVEFNGLVAVGNCSVVILDCLVDVAALTVGARKFRIEFDGLFAVGKCEVVGFV
jgi:hypothetical protein